MSSCTRSGFNSPIIRYANIQIVQISGIRGSHKRWDTTITWFIHGIVRVVYHIVYSFLGSSGDQDGISDQD